MKKPKYGKSLKIYDRLDEWQKSLYDEFKEKIKLYQAMETEREKIFEKLIEYENCINKDDRAYKIMIEIAENIGGVEKDIYNEIEKLSEKIDRVQKVAMKYYEIVLTKI